MKRRSFLKTLLGVAGAALAGVSLSTQATLPAPVVDSGSHTWGGIARGAYPPLRSDTSGLIMVMHPAQLKAYQALGYDQTK